jgi:hypothetical protein
MGKLIYKVGWVTGRWRGCVIFATTFGDFSLISWVPKSQKTHGLAPLDHGEQTDGR